MKSREATLVYTSGPAAKQVGPEGTQPPASTVRAGNARLPTIRVGIDKKRRRGKTVTVATGFQLSEEALAALASEMKKRCGAGGTSRDHEIEIQGEHVELLVNELQQRGYRVKS